MDNSLYLVFVEFNPAKELKYKQNDIDNYNTWLYLRCNKDKPKIAPENTVAVGFASYDWLFNRGKMLGIAIDGKLKMLDLTYRNYKIKPTYKITDGITKRSYLPENDVYTQNGNHKFTYYELHSMDLKRVTQYWNNIKSNPKIIPRSNLEIELNFCQPHPKPYAYKDLIDIKGAEWAGYLEDFPTKYSKNYDDLIKMAIAKNDKGEPSMADYVYVQPNNAQIKLQINGNVKGVFSVDQKENQLIDLGNYSTVTPSNCTITIKSNGKYLGSFTLNQDNDSVIDIGDLSNYYTKPEVDNLLSNISGGTGGSLFDMWPDGAEAHNAMWGGRDITEAFDAGTVSKHIADGTFKDIFPGDYITKQVTIFGMTHDVTWVIADCDYWVNKGDTLVKAHHVVIVPQALDQAFDARMNSARTPEGAYRGSTTEGGYAGSDMYRNVIPIWATGIVNAFGSDHILTFKDLITNKVDNGTSSDWGWYSVQCNLMCERMVYGMPAFSSSAWDAGVATRQFSAFRLSEKLINPDRHNWWLRDVAPSTCFAIVDGDGHVGVSGAHFLNGVRPFALLA